MVISKINRKDRFVAKLAVKYGVIGNRSGKCLSEITTRSRVIISISAKSS